MSLVLLFDEALAANRLWRAVLLLLLLLLEEEEEKDDEDDEDDEEDVVVVGGVLTRRASKEKSLGVRVDDFWGWDMRGRMVERMKWREETNEKGYLVTTSVQKEYVTL